MTHHHTTQNGAQILLRQQRNRMSDAQQLRERRTSWLISAVLITSLAIITGLYIWALQGPAIKARLEAQLFAQEQV